MLRGIINQKGESLMKKTSFFDQDNYDFHLVSISFRAAKVGFYNQFGRRAYNEIVYKLDGSSEQRFDNLTLELVPDSIYFIPKFSSNSQLIKDPGTIILVEFEMLGKTDGSEFPPEIIHLDSGNPYKKLFLGAEELWRHKYAGYYLKAHSMISEVLSKIVGDREKQYMQSSKYALIAPALNYIRDNYRTEISVSSLAKLCGISDEYLRVLFKSYTGQTPLSYTNTLRLENARDMLRSGYVSVAEAAEANGFESPGYFSRIFKKHFRISPSKVCQIEAEMPDFYNKENN